MFLHCAWVGGHGGQITAPSSGQPWTFLRALGLSLDPRLALSVEEEGDVKLSSPKDAGFPEVREGRGHTPDPSMSPPTTIQQAEHARPAEPWEWET